jgi:hypothetical protein
MMCSTRSTPKHKCMLLSQLLAAHACCLCVRCRQYLTLVPSRLRPLSSSSSSSSSFSLPRSYKLVNAPELDYDASLAGGGERYIMHHTHHTTSAYTMHSYTIHHPPSTIHHPPSTIHSYTIYHTPYTTHHTPYTIHHTPYTIHHTPYTIHCTPYTIHHTPYTIHTIHHTPYTHTLIHSYTHTSCTTVLILYAIYASLQ